MWRELSGAAVGLVAAARAFAATPSPAPAAGGGQGPPKAAAAQPPPPPDAHCVVCARPPLVPVALAPCGHTACYYCAAARCRAHPAAACALCGARIAAVVRISDA